MTTNPIYPANGLEIDFLGLPMIFNDGQAENTLQIALTNNNFFGTLQPEQDSTIVFNRNTPISLWFVVDVAQASAVPERHWALTSYDMLHDAAVALTATPGDWDIYRSDDLPRNNPLNDSLNGWKLVARDLVTLSPGQSVVLTLSGLKSSSPDGPASGYLQVDMPNTRSGSERPSFTQVIGPITKSKVMIKGERMGIGTGSPNSALVVNGGVQAKGRTLGVQEYTTDGFYLFDEAGGSGPGMTSLGDGNLVFVVNGKQRLSIQHTQEKDLSNLFGSLWVSDNLQVNGRIVSRWGDIMPIGAIIAYAPDVLPPGWLLCDGQPVPPGVDYDDLRWVLGKRSVPDLRDRFIGSPPYYTVKYIMKYYS